MYKYNFTFIIVILTFIGFSVLGNDKKALEETLKNKFTSNISNKIKNITNGITETISNYNNIEYLEINTEFNANEKASLELLNINKVSESNNLVLFNQNSLSLHDNNQTINLGLGIRNLIHDDRIIIGANAFYDYNFNEKHQRNGFGIEGKSSLFDLTSNFYNAISNEKTTDDGTEEALDGWDLRMDYHIPVKGDVDLFANFFEFENNKKTYKQEGNQIGISSTFNNINLELGYQDDNKGNDGGFAKIGYIINFGKENKAVPKEIYLTKMVSIKERLYEPVKRENKIRLVKISSTGVSVSGF